MYLFGDLGEIHILLSLIRISFKAHKNPFWYSTHNLLFLPSPVDFVHPKAARSSLVVLSLGWIKGLRQEPIMLGTVRLKLYSNLNMSLLLTSKVTTELHNTISVQEIVIVKLMGAEVTATMMIVM